MVDKFMFVLNILSSKNKGIIIYYYNLTKTAAPGSCLHGDLNHAHALKTIAVISTKNT